MHTRLGQQQRQSSSCDEPHGYRGFSTTLAHLTFANTLLKALQLTTTNATYDTTADKTVTSTSLGVHR